MFIGNQLKYNELLTWLQNGSEAGAAERVCVVTGPVGCGKTYGIKAATAETGKLVSIFDSTTCSNGKDFLDKFTKATQSNVVAQFTHTGMSDRIMFIDELDALLTIDRTFLSNLKNIPHGIRVLIACSLDTVKRIPIAHKLISLNAASEADILIFLKESTSAEGKCVKAKSKAKAKSVSAKLLVEAAEMCNGNIGAALKYIPKLGLTDPFPEVGSIYRSPEGAAAVFSLDVWLNPLRFHENLLYELKQRLQPRQKAKVYASLMEDLCTWDFLMTRNIEAAEYAVAFIAAAVKKLDRLPLKKSAPPPQAEFTRLINLLSVRKKALNALYTSGMEFPWHDIGSYEKSFLHRK
jgi:SpoVK/Ycf46/Vps4 family AAA+-type ATPase